MILSLIVAIDEDNVIGDSVKNDMPWHLPDDLKHFKNITKGHPVIMGRKTHESVGRALPDRLNIVVSRNPDFNAEGCMVVPSLHDAIDVAQRQDVEEVFVIGGGQLYQAALPVADRLYMTRVQAHVPGDVRFPDISFEQWEEVSREEHGADARHIFPFSWVVYEKVK